MAYAPIPAQDTTWEIEDPALTFTEILGVTSASESGGEAPDIDVTTLKSTAREFLSGLAGGADVALNFFWNRTDPGQGKLESVAGNGTNYNFRVTLNDGTIATFSAAVKKYSLFPSLGVDAVGTGTASLKMSGAVTWT